MTARFDVSANLVNTSCGDLSCARAIQPGDLALCRKENGVPWTHWECIPEVMRATIKSRGGLRHLVGWAHLTDDQQARVEALLADVDLVKFKRQGPVPVRKPLAPAPLAAKTPSNIPEVSKYAKDLLLASHRREVRAKQRAKDKENRVPAPAPVEPRKRKERPVIVRPTLATKGRKRPSTSSTA
ncbi:hypothetical protein AURDEDRAFT_188316 [Auricularia subglabra TFB-10046 SS5]|uniref:PARP-type domain-containing protein n=1 Tax=Auricularia subglabra (strain TFB-10046 / SS5) TaxID=717982 RepID=J0D9V6_AURST|nr:hypothetical protein AURDEDRAFT_188316 [Auricularia subglabra TFB-10046 SS5]